MVHYSAFVIYRRTMLTPLLLLTGLAMLAADLKTFVASPVLWIKLGLVALLVVDGVVLERTETALRRPEHSAHDQASVSLWNRLRISAIVSIALWIATLVAGSVLVSAA